LALFPASGDLRHLHWSTEQLRASRIERPLETIKPWAYQLTQQSITVRLHSPKPSGNRQRFCAARGLANFSRNHQAYSPLKSEIRFKMATPGMENAAKTAEFKEDLNNILMCRDCKEFPPNLIEEFSSGDMVCTTCGLVVGERIIDTRSECVRFPTTTRVTMIRLVLVTDRIS